MDLSSYLAIPVKPGGRDRDGVDCWGLVCVIYEEQFGIALPKYEGVDWTKEKEVWEAIAKTTADEWLEIPHSERRASDVCVLRIAATPWHVGMLTSTLQFIHADPLRGVSVQRLDSVHWKNRVVGYFRLPS